MSQRKRIHDYRRGQMVKKTRATRPAIAGGPHVDWPAPAERLQRAIGHLQNDETPEAERLAGSLLQTPMAAGGYLLLGQIELRRGQFEEAVRILEKTRGLSTGEAARVVDGLLALAVFHQGRESEAHTRLRQAGLINRQGLAVWNEMGVYWKQNGHPAWAIATYRFLTRQVPDFAEAHYNLGLALMGNPITAIGPLKRAAELAPQAAPTHFGVGNALHASGQFEGALAAFDRAIARRATWPQAWLNRGNTLFEMARLTEAGDSYQESLKLDPRQAAALTNLGNVHRELGRLDAAARFYQKAIALEPDLAEAIMNLGTVSKLQGDLQAAMEHFSRALSINPDSIEALTNLGNVHREMGRLDQARSCYQAVEQLQPNELFYRLRAATLCPRVFGDQNHFDTFYNRLLEQVSALAQQVEQTATPHSDQTTELASLIKSAIEPPFDVQFYPGNIRGLKEAYARVFEPTFARMQEPLPTARRDRPLIGIVVTKRHEGIFLRSMKGVLERMDPDRFQIVVFGSALGQELLEKGLGHTAIQRAVLPDRFQAASAAIRGAACDILYYWEVGTDALNYFLPFLRLAPVQCTSWGIQVTSGIRHLDYYVSNEFVEPADADQHYSEDLIRARTFLTHQFRPVMPDQILGRDRLGLPANGPLFVCPQNIGKIHSDFDATLDAILQRDSRGHVVLIGDDFGVWSQLLRERLLRTMPATASRVVILPRLNRDAYLSLLRHATVILDPPHFGGVNTSYDAFGLGKVILTLPSPYHRGRYTAGCYAKMGLSSWVQSSREDYVSRAISLATCEDTRREAEAGIRDMSSHLFEDPQAVSEHERIFAQFAAAAQQVRPLRTA